MIDFITKERVQISETTNDTALNCTPDGKWVLYDDSKFIRTDKGEMSLDEYLKKYEHGSPAPYHVYYIYRYEVATGKRERVAAASDDEGGSYEAISPDGTKILLGNRHALSTDLYVPEWEPVWFSNDWWERYETRWFSDSTGVVHIRNNPNSICVEFFGKNGWARCFELDLKYKDNIDGLLLDKEDGIYFQITRDYRDASGIYSVYRCEIEDRELKCEEVAKERKSGSPVAFLLDGDLILQGRCIRRARSWQAQGECVVDRRYGDTKYRHISLIGVSPDGRWLAFERYRKELKMGSGQFVWTEDLFVIDLKND